MKLTVESRLLMIDFKKMVMTLEIWMFKECRAHGCKDVY